MARKSKISKELIDEFLTYKENGISDKDACDMCGIAHSTFYRWLDEAETEINGNDPKRPVADLALKKDLRAGLKKAKASFKAYHIQNITKASKKTWQASAWILERMYPEEFGRIDRTNVQVSENKEEIEDDGFMAALTATANNIKDYVGDEPEHD